MPLNAKEEREIQETKKENNAQREQAGGGSFSYKGSVLDRY
jgi:hypothetical protein